MSDHRQSIPPQLVAAEARAAAHQLRALAERLLTLAGLLPVPPEAELDQLPDDEEAFARFPAYELHADLHIAVTDGLAPFADLLEEAGRRPLDRDG